MASKNKLKKLVNAYCCPMTLKDKKWRCKRVMFYTSAQRQQLKKELDHDKG